VKLINLKNVSIPPEPQGRLIRQLQRFGGSSSSMEGAAASGGARTPLVLAAVATLLLLFLAATADGFRLPNAHTKPSARSGCKSGV
jgi:hypothetical protein